MEYQLGMIWQMRVDKKQQEKIKWKNVIVNVIAVKIVRNVMPNRAAKERKRQRRLKNEWLNRHGRTARQIKRNRKKNGSSKNTR